MAYTMKDNIEQSLALERWAISQEMNPSDVLYASLRLMAAQFILKQAIDKVPPNKMVADLDSMREVVGQIFKAMVREIIVEVVKPQ